jgi:carbamoyltransferase
MVYDRKWERIFGFPRREPESELQQHHCNLALAIQQVTEEIVLKLAQEAKRLTGAEYLCLAGGVALNCVANGKLQREKIFKKLYIQPAAGDAGGALGAALAASHIYFGEARVKPEFHDLMKGSYLGPSYCDKEIELISRKLKAVYVRIQNVEELTRLTATKLAEGKVVGWFQGRMEFGPRALGNRSILGDPRNPDMQKKLNLKIKYREGFRPFAPSVLAEEKEAYFELDAASPYMLLVAPVQEHRRISLPLDYYSRSLWDRLYYVRSDIQSVTHLDFSARVQTVHRETNPLYWQLIKSFKDITGYGVIVNTSFNIRGEPIVCTPEDAYRCFMSTEMDILVIGQFMYKKEEQPDWQNRKRWLKSYKLD